MTDEGSAPPPPAAEVSGPAAAEAAPVESAPAPVPEAPPVPAVEVAAEPAPALQNTEAAPPEPVAVVTPEVVKEISSEITEAVKDAVMGEKAETHEATPQIPIPEESPHNAEINTEAAPPELPEVGAEVVAEAPRAQQVSETSPVSPPQFDIRSLKPLAVAAIRAKKRARIERIFELKACKSVIKNDDVQKHLRVSDSAAADYLSELTKEGRLERFGIGKGIRYKFK